MESFNLKQLYKVESTKQYQVEISNRFAALENLVTEVILIEPGKLVERI
jgi:hypothetical protein